PMITLARRVAMIFAVASAALTVDPLTLTAQQAVDVEANCPVTQPPPQPFVPPSPHPARPFEPMEGGQASRFYFGSEKLWVTLVRGTWQGTSTPDGARRVKFVWFADDLTTEES